MQAWLCWARICDLGLFGIILGFGMAPTSAWSTAAAAAAGGGSSQPGLWGPGLCRPRFVGPGLCRPGFVGPPWAWPRTSAGTEEGSPAAASAAGTSWMSLELKIRERTTWILSGNSLFLGR